MDQHEQQMMRGEEAQRILNSPAWIAAFTDTRTAMLEALAGLDTLDDKHAPELHRMVRCLEKVKRALEEHVTTGKLAHKEIEMRKKRFSFLKQP
jgi:hypothetical protein